MASCFICPMNGSRMCGVRNCADCGECDMADASPVSMQEERKDEW